MSIFAFLFLKVADVLCNNSILARENHVKQALARLLASFKTDTSAGGYKRAKSYGHSGIFKGLNFDSN